MTLRERLEAVANGSGPVLVAPYQKGPGRDPNQALRDDIKGLLALLPALPPGEPTDDEVRDWAYNTLATDTDGDTRGVWWSTITPARKGMYRRAMLSARPSPPATLWEREPDTDEWRSQGHETQVISE